MDNSVPWDVDDIKISHANEQVESDVVSELEKEYGKEAPLSLSCGRKHNYLGMVHDYTKVGAIQVTMFDYIENMLSELPSEMEGESRTLHHYTCLM